MKKKILFLINTLEGGGAEKVLVDVVNNLDASKFEITVQTVIDSGVYQSSLHKNIKYKSIFKKSKNIIHKIYLHLRLKLLFFKTNLSKFYKKNIENDYDIEVAFLEGLPTKILSFSSNTNKIAWVHTDLFGYYDGQLEVYKTLQKNIECYKRYKKIVLVSNAAKDGFVKRFGDFDNLIIQHNPIDEKQVKQRSYEKITEFDLGGKLKIISVGRLIDQKGYDRLLKAHKRLIDEGFDYNLIILGEGIERNKLEWFIKQNKIENNTRLYGFVSNPYKFIKQSDVFICSSRNEGFSLVIAESMIIGVPVVSTFCSGPTELLENGKFGMIVENSEDGIYEGLKKIITDENLRQEYKEKAIERGNSFNLSKIIKEITGIFGE